MSDEVGYVKIGMPEVYDGLRRVAEGNQRLEAKVDTALSIQTLRLEQLQKEVSRLEGMVTAALQQIDEIESRPVVTPKALLATATVMGIIVAIVTSVVGLFIK
jgi:hypothetical protein